MRSGLIFFLLIGCGEEITTITTPKDGELLTDNDADGYPSDEDCDDNDSTIHPGAEELCDGFDNNCDNQADEGVMDTFYADSDSDGFGNPGIPTEGCEAPLGFAFSFLRKNGPPGSNWRVRRTFRPRLLIKVHQQVRGVIPIRQITR